MFLSARRLRVVSGVHVSAEVLVEVFEAIVHEHVSLEGQPHKLGLFVFCRGFVSALATAPPYLKHLLDSKRDGAAAGFSSKAHIFTLIKTFVTRPCLCVVQLRRQQKTH